MNITNEDNIELMARYKDNHFDLAIVDPPYGIGISKNPVRQQHDKKEWDNAIPTEEYFNELFRVSKEQIIWGGNYFISDIKNKLHQGIDQKNQENKQIAAYGTSIGGTTFIFNYEIF